MLDASMRFSVPKERSLPIVFLIIITLRGRGITERIDYVNMKEKGKMYKDSRPL